MHKELHIRCFKIHWGTLDDHAMYIATTMISILLQHHVNTIRIYFFAVSTKS